MDQHTTAETQTLAELLARWDTDEGKPHKGNLIDWSAYDGDGTEPPADMGCMCAQGQALYAIGGWTPRQLRNTSQSDADTATAKLLNISRAHAILLRTVNDSVDGAPGIVLTDPGKVLGDQWSKLLDFWWHMDTLGAEGWGIVTAARVAAGAAAGAAAWDAARAAAGVSAWDAAGTAARDAAWVAAWEIQGAVIFERAKRPFYFLPMFGFATLDQIPARPANYGEAA